MEADTILSILGNYADPTPAPTTMDLKEIDNVPKFEPDVDPLILENLKSEADRLLAKSLSKMQQKSDWAAETARRSHNASVRLYHLTFWIGGLVVAGIIANVVTKIAS